MLLYINTKLTVKTLNECLIPLSLISNLLESSTFTHGLPSRPPKTKVTCVKLQCKFVEKENTTNTIKKIIKLYHCISEGLFFLLSQLRAIKAE